MKCEKVTKAHHILLMTKRFNEMSRAVTSEILRQPEISKRVSVIEKWAAVADICRCLHNFNGVLQICAAFTNSSVFRLKKTWEKVCKTVSKRFLLQVLQTCRPIFLFFMVQSFNILMQEAGKHGTALSRVHPSSSKEILLSSLSDLLSYSYSLSPFLFPVLRDGFCLHSTSSPDRRSISCKRSSPRMAGFVT